MADTAPARSAATNQPRISHFRQAASRRAEVSTVFVCLRQIVKAHKCSVWIEISMIQHPKIKLKIDLTPQLGISSPESGASR